MILWIDKNFSSSNSFVINFSSKLGAYPSLLNVFLGRPVFGEVFLERIPFEDIPSEMNQSANWLLNNFEKKVSSGNHRWFLYSAIKTIRIKRFRISWWMLTRRMAFSQLLLRKRMQNIWMDQFDGKWNLLYIFLKYVDHFYSIFKLNLVIIDHVPQCHFCYFAYGQASVYHLFLTLSNGYWAQGSQVYWRSFLFLG